MPAISDAQLASKIAKDIDDLACGHVRISTTLNVADAMTIGAGGTIETWTASAGGAGAGEFDQSGGTAVLCATSLVAKINALPGSQVRAILGEHGGANDAVVLLFAKTVAAGNLALAITVGGARWQVSAAAMTGSAAAVVSQRSWRQRAITAEDVAAMAAGIRQEIALGAFNSTTEPQLVSMPFVRTALGDVYSPSTLIFKALQSGANEWVMMLEESALVSVLGAGDLLTFEVGLT